MKQFEKVHLLYKKYDLKKKRGKSKTFISVSLILLFIENYHHTIDRMFICLKILNKRTFKIRKNVNTALKYRTATLIKKK